MTPPFGKEVKTVIIVDKSLILFKHVIKFLSVPSDFYLILFFFLFGAGARTRLASGTPKIRQGATFFWVYIAPINAPNKNVNRSQEVKNGVNYL